LTLNTQGCKLITDNYKDAIMSRGEDVRAALGAICEQVTPGKESRFYVPPQLLGGLAELSEPVPAAVRGMARRILPDALVNRLPVDDLAGCVAFVRAGGAEAEKPVDFH
jgi:hypothetical protein